MDTLAKAYWLRCHCQNMPASQQVHNYEWAIWIGNEKMCKTFKNAIGEKLQQHPLEKKSGSKIQRTLRRIKFDPSLSWWRFKLENLCGRAGDTTFLNLLPTYSPMGHNMK
jgi:hypothetical protein